MIRVLQNWQEIGSSILALQKAGLPAHETPQKNWDHFLLYELLALADKSSVIADLGCGDGHALSLLRALGFKKLHGVDFQISWRLRARRLVSMQRNKSLRLPYRLYKSDIISTRLRADSCDFVTSISTIEHGVDLRQFFKEACRILKPGGDLFITTDYWETKINTDGASAYGLPWNIFSRDGVVELIHIAAANGFDVSNLNAIPACSERTITWQGESYTFIAMQFKRID